MGIGLDKKADTHCKKPNNFAKSMKWGFVRTQQVSDQKASVAKNLFCKKAKEVAKYHKIGFGLKMSLTRTSSAGFPTDKCIYSPSHPT